MASSKQPVWDRNSYNSPPATDSGHGRAEIVISRSLGRTTPLLRFQHTTRQLQHHQDNAEGLAILLNVFRVPLHREEPQDIAVLNFGHGCQLALDLSACAGVLVQAAAMHDLERNMLPRLLVDTQLHPEHNNKSRIRPGVNGSMNNGSL